MKKLMIAAAAAAMIGGVEAVNLTDWSAAGTAYNATINLKTTVGKTKNATTTYYLGKDRAGTAMWYEDASITNVIAQDLANTTNGFEHKFTTKKIAGKPVPVLTSAGKKDDKTLALVIPLATTDKSGKNSDGKPYGLQSAGKWCDSFSVKDEYCYRTAGTVKVSGIVVDDCCASGFVDFAHVFGDYTLPKSKKVEIYAADASSLNIYDPKEDTPTSVAVKDNLKYDRVINALAIAGQGSYGTVKANNGTGDLTEVRGIVSVSGNAVGTCDSVLCTSCCISGGITQFAWNCADGSDASASDTAAYGTFSLKYNASFTK